MKVAFCILAHSQPLLTSRLVRRLTGFGDIYLHVDKKVDIAPFKKLLGDVVFYAQRYNVTWGASNQVSTFLHMMEEASRRAHYDYFSTHSGVDYPARPLPEFISFLENHNGEEFIECFPIPEDLRHRYEWYHLNTLKGRVYPPFADKILTKPLEKIMRGVEHCLAEILPKRGHYNSFAPYKGSNWFTVTNTFAKTAWSYWNNNPSVRRYAFFMHCPDEWYMQTIGAALGFSPRFSKHGSLYYIDWSEIARSPKILTEHDLTDIVGSKQFFTRKMSMESLELMDMLDSYAQA